MHDDAQIMLKRQTTWEAWERGQPVRPLARGERLAP